jgi:hypothetical protein
MPAIETSPKILNVVNRLRRAMPNADQVNITRMTNEELRFEWRGTSYRVTDDMYVEEVGDGVLIGSDSAALIRRLLEQQLVLEGRK